MIYGVLRNPHQNSRYYDASEHLLTLELDVMLKAEAISYEARGFKNFGALSLFVFETREALEPKQIAMLQRMSTALALFEIKDEWLKPLDQVFQPYFKTDLASILKYSGKTNEDFTGLMLNVGVFSSAFKAQYDEPLTIFDPMSGRGTTLYKALMLGYNSTGVEKNKTDCVEMNQYLKRYFKYHHYKHEAKHQSIVQKGKTYGTKYTMTTADTKEHYKANDLRTLSFSSGDTCDANMYYKKGHAHVLVTDLPYGVQHPAPQMLALLAKAAPVWHNMLQKGGTAVIAFNTYHLEKQALTEVFEKVGFKAISLGNFEHWVEQAVNRDIVILKSM